MIPSPRLDVPAAALPVLEEYLRRLSVGLPPGWQRRRSIVAEVADGLTCALFARLDGGRCDGGGTEGEQDPRAAAIGVVEEFGDPAVLARQFAAEVVPVAARRAGLSLLLTGPVVGLVWAAAYGSGEPSWPSKIVDVLSSVGGYPAILAIAVPAAVVAATRRAPRKWLGIAALVALVACVLGDLILISSALRGDVLAAHGAIAVVALCVSAIRSCAALAATRRIVRLRAAGY